MSLTGINFGSLFMIFFGYQMFENGTVRLSIIIVEHSTKNLQISCVFDKRTEQCSQRARV